MEICTKCGGVLTFELLIDIWDVPITLPVEKCLICGEIYEEQYQAHKSMAGQPVQNTESPDKKIPQRRPHHNRKQPQSRIAVVEYDWW